MNTPRDLPKLKEILEKVPRKPKTRSRSVKLGMAGCLLTGKTSFLRFRQCCFDKPHPTGDPQGLRFCRAQTLPSGETLIVNYTAIDVGGEKYYADYTSAMLAKWRSIRGLVMVVDHSLDSTYDISSERLAEHLERVQHMSAHLKMIPHRHTTPVLFLINKKDLWNHSESVIDMANRFHPHMKSFTDVVGRRVIVSTVSAVTGDSISHAMTAFERELFPDLFE